MKLGIMQPYLFPYIGYFQIIWAVDTFVVYDDVQYKKGGWINRNRVLLNGNSHIFTFGVTRDSIQTLIKNRVFSETIADNRARLMALLHNCYRKAPFHDETCNLVYEILCFEEQNVSGFIYNSIQLVCKYLGIDRNILLSSSLCKNTSLKSQDRVIDICKRLNADHYINAIGGTKLYDRERFRRENIALNFLNPILREYNQFGDSFIPALSIIDVLMFNDIESIRGLLDSYELV